MTASSDEPHGWLAPPPAISAALIVVCAAVIGLLVFKLADVLLLGFAAVLVAILIHAVARPFRMLGRIHSRLPLVAAVATLAAAAAIFISALGAQVEAQLAALGNLLPQAWATAKATLAGSWLGREALETLDGWDGLRAAALDLAPQLTVSAFTALVSVIIVLFAGLYLAFHPQSYLDGALHLVPRPFRREVERVLYACYFAIRRWLAGQLISMLLVGVTIGLGFWAIGLPSPLALGMVAGVAQFVPVIGPMAAAVPGLLLAFAVGPQTLGWTALVYFGATQLEANLFSPLILRQMVETPMAVTLFAVLAMGLLLGPLGALLATPLAVVTYVALKTAYVNGFLARRGWD